MESTANLVSPSVERALRYIELLTIQGVGPTPEQVDAFATDDGPKPALYGSLFASFSSMTGGHGLGGPKIRDAEPVSGYLVRMDWAGVVGGRTQNRGRLQLTDLGYAFLQGLVAGDDRATARDRTPVVVNLEPNSPMAFVEYASAVAEAGPGLLVDSYFKAETLEWLVKQTTIARVLVSSLKSAKAELGRIATLLGYLPDSGRIIEVRSSSSTELHDRGIVNDGGGVTLIGTSLTGIGKHASTIVKLAPQDSRSLAERFEGLWDAAEVVAPVRLQAQRPDGPGDDVGQATGSGG